MSRVKLKDMQALLDSATYTDDYGVPGSTFTVCRICDHESGAGVLKKLDWHSKYCPVPRLQAKYQHRGPRKKGHDA